MKREIELLEIRRQSVHLIFGMMLALIYYFDLVDKLSFLLFLLLTVALCYISKAYHIPIFSDFLRIFGRSNNQGLPGRGLVYFVLGSTLVVLFFSKEIAIASILILAFGDSVSHIFGRHFGNIKLKFHEKKHIEGTFFGIIISTFAASFTVFPMHAFIASIIAMVFEYPTVKINNFKIDDNILVPLSAGFTLFLLSKL